jgi:hypothetical protein
MLSLPYLRQWSQRLQANCGCGYSKRQSSFLGSKSLSTGMSAFTAILGTSGSGRPLRGYFATRP